MLTDLDTPPIRVQPAFPAHTSNIEIESYALLLDNIKSHVRVMYTALLFECLGIEPMVPLCTAFHVAESELDGPQE